MPTACTDSTRKPPRCQSGKASASGAADLGSVPAFPAGLFPGWVVPVTLTNVTPVATLPGAFRYGVGVKQFSSWDEHRSKGVGPAGSVPEQWL